MSTSMIKHLSMTDLFSKLKKSTNEETALTITQAFEQFHEDQKAEIDVKDLATKEDLSNAMQHLETRMATKEELAKLEVKVFKYVSEAKWQVMGVIAFFFFTAIVCKHLGLL